MRLNKLSGNSADHQLKDAATRFDAVKRSAEVFEQHEKRTVALLHIALAGLYELGEVLRAQPTEPGRSLLEEFVTARGRAWNRPTRRNPYIALVKLAFEQSESSLSQYASVLLHASKSNVEPAEFKAWLQDGGGIKGRYAEAAVHAGNTRSQRNSLERASRLKIAQELLSGRDHSQSVELPAGVGAPEGFEGFALVLAMISGDGKAALVDVIETTEAALEPVLLSYAPSTATAKGILAADPLGHLYRAIDLILGCTGDKTDGYVRNILLINSFDGDLPVCRVEAVSEAYTYAWAGMMLSGHLDSLPANIPFILTHDDAAFFTSEFVNHADWSMTIAERPRIDASGLRSPIELRPLEPAVRYRISQAPSRHEKRFSSTHSDQLTVQQFLRDRLADHERLNSKRKEKQPFPSTLSVHSRGGKLEIGLAKLPNLTATFGSSVPDRDLSHLALDMADVKRALGALIPYETTVDGAFADIEVDDAALCFQAHFGDDVLTVVLPTKSGTDYNQSCIDLELPVTSQRTSTA